MIALQIAISLNYIKGEERNGGQQNISFSFFLGLGKMLIGTILARFLENATGQKGYQPPYFHHGFGNASRGK